MTFIQVTIRYRHNLVYLYPELAATGWFELDNWIHFNKLPTGSAEAVRWLEAVSY